MGSDGTRAESSAAEIVFRGVTKRYPGRTSAAVDNLSLRIPAGEICVLVGPSGGGKTTAMKMVNRLIEITEGDILIDGSSVRSLDVIELRRRIGYVIQHVGLFPHMSVADNIATVPRLLGWPKARIKAIAVRKADAKKYHLKTLFDLKRLQNSAQRPKNFSIGGQVPKANGL